MAHIYDIDAELIPTDVVEDRTDTGYPIVCPVDRVDLAEPLVTRWRWEYSDPCRVRVEMHPAGHQSVEWAFSRDLLQSGLVSYDQPVGQGDVTVQTIDLGDTVRLLLRRECSRAVLHLPRVTVSHFLAGTLAWVVNGADDGGADRVERALHEATPDLTEGPAVRVADAMQTLRSKYGTT